MCVPPDNCWVVVIVPTGFIILYYYYTPHQIQHSLNNGQLVYMYVNYTPPYVPKFINYIYPSSSQKVSRINSSQAGVYLHLYTSWPWFIYNKGREVKWANPKIRNEKLLKLLIRLLERNSHLFVYVKPPLWSFSLYTWYFNPQPREG